MSDTKEISVNDLLLMQHKLLQHQADLRYNADKLQEHIDKIDRLLGRETLNLVPKESPCVWNDINSR